MRLVHFLVRAVALPFVALGYVAGCVWTAIEAGVILADQHGEEAAQRFKAWKESRNVPPSEGQG